MASSNGEEENESHLSDIVQQSEASSVKDLRVAHLNVYSIRNKIDELRCLQLLCRFELIGITETHLDKTVRDEALQIESMKLSAGLICRSRVAACRSRVAGRGLQVAGHRLQVADN